MVYPYPKQWFCFQHFSANGQPERLSTNQTNPVTSNTVNNQECLTEPPVSIARPQFDIGDIVWAQARALPHGLVKWWMQASLERRDRMMERYVNFR